LLFLKKEAETLSASCKNAHNTYNISSDAAGKIVKQPQRRGYNETTHLTG
jgi:hypothetical protein